MRDRGGYLYSHVSGGKFYSEKIIAIFSGGKNYYMSGEMLPYLSSDADVYTYLDASENSVMQQTRQHWRKCF